MNTYMPPEGSLRKATRWFAPAGVKLSKEMVKAVASPISQRVSTNQKKMELDLWYISPSSSAGIRVEVCLLTKRLTNTSSSSIA